MGTPGVPINIPKAVIVECIKKKKGIGTQICVQLDISYDTFLKLIDKYDLRQELNAARNDFDETICDMAETALMRALNQADDLSASLSSAKFVLNNKGKKRGYSPPVAAINNDMDIHALVRGIKEVHENAPSAAAGQSGMEIEPSVSDSRQERELNKVSAKRRTK